VVQRCDGLVLCRTGLDHINIGQLVQEDGLHCGMDEEYGCFVLDEDKVCDALEPRMSQGGKIVDHHWYVTASSWRSVPSILYTTAAH
jgi:broad-specificity NMP kinase